MKPIAIAMLLLLTDAGVARADVSDVAPTATADAAGDRASVLPDASKLATYGLAGAGLLYRKLKTRRA